MVGTLARNQTSALSHQDLNLLGSAARALPARTGASKTALERFLSIEGIINYHTVTAANALDDPIPLSVNLWALQAVVPACTPLRAFAHVGMEAIAKSTAVSSEFRNADVSTQLERRPCLMAYSIRHSLTRAS